MVRAQAALEFLMTYGWAMAVVLGAIGTLMYLGVFDLDVFMTEKCEFSSGIYCIDGVATPTQVKLAIQNGIAITMENVQVSVSECGAATGPSELAAGEQGDFIVDCVLSSGSIFKTNVVFNYTNPDSGYNHTKIGQFVYKVA